jgi:hypothetical protein
MKLRLLQARVSPPAAHISPLYMKFHDMLENKIGDNTIVLWN